MSLDGLLDPGSSSGGEVLGALNLSGKVLEYLCNSGVQHSVGIGQIHGRAGHTELKLVAGEGKGRGTVPVGVVLGEYGKNVNAQVDLGLALGLIGAVVGDGIENGTQLIAHKDGDDGGGSLISAQAMVVSGRGNSDTKQILIIIHGLDDGSEESQELEVIHGGVAGIQQVLAAGGQRPVVVFAGAIDTIEGLLVNQAHKTVALGNLLHHFHSQQIVIDGLVGGVENGCQFVLCGSNLVVLGAGGDAQLPQLVVQLLHEFGDLGTNHAKVMLLQLLALGGGMTEQGTASEDQILALLIILLADQEILLLGADGGGDMGAAFAKELQNLAGFGGDGLHGAEQGGLLIQCLAGVGAESSGNAQNVIFYKGIAGGIPCGIAAGLTGGTQTAGGEGGCVGLTLNELLTFKLHNGSAIAHGRHKPIVLLGGDAGEGLEPVGIMGGTLFDGPVLHNAGHNVRHIQIKGLALVDGCLQALVGGAGQTLLHNVLVEYHGAVDFLGVCCHIDLLLF